MASRHQRWSRAFVVVALIVSLASAVGVYFYIDSLPEHWGAGAVILADPSSESPDNLPGAFARIDQTRISLARLQMLARSEEVLNSAAALHQTDQHTLKKNLSFEIDDGAGQLIIRHKSFTPQAAVAELDTILSLLRNTYLQTIDRAAESAVSALKNEETELENQLRRMPESEGPTKAELENALKEARSLIIQKRLSYLALAQGWQIHQFPRPEKLPIDYPILELTLAAFVLTLSTLLAGMKFVSPRSD